MTLPRIGWQLHGDGKTPPPGEVVAPGERLTWPRTIGLGAQHVIAMFGATFVFPFLMGLDPNLAVMMSGFATLLFLLIVKGKVPSYLGSSASFLAVALTIRSEGGSLAQLTGALLTVGLALMVFGIIVHLGGARIINAILPPVVTGAVVMLIGLNLAPVVSGTYWPADQWVALATMFAVILMNVLLKGFWSRISILLGLVFGCALSWVLDLFGPVSHDPKTHEAIYRIDFSKVEAAKWIGFPHVHTPSFHASFILIALPLVIALVAENAGHVKAVSEMTHTNLDGSLGRALFADGLATTGSTFFGGPPTTTYAENIGVMAATRVYSTAAYMVAAFIAILFGLCPKFGALVASVPYGVLGGIVVVLYGMIALLGAKIWVENKVDFGKPINLVPAAAGIIIGAGGTTLQITKDFPLAGIPLGTLVVVIGYHLLRLLAPRDVKEKLPAGKAYEGGAAIIGGDVVDEPEYRPDDDATDRRP